MTLDRRSLVVPGQIVERMARDILAARRERPGVLLVDLTEAGWTTAQAARFGASAHGLANRPDFACEDAERRAEEEDDTRPTPMAADGVVSLAAARAAAKVLARPVSTLPSDEGDVA